MGGWPSESPMLAQRAVSEDPRWTRAVGDSSGPSWDSVDEQARKSHVSYSLRPCWTNVLSIL